MIGPQEKKRVNAALKANGIKGFKLPFAPCGTRVIICPILDNLKLEETEHVPGSSVILAPQKTKDKMKRESTRGIVVAAGLTARDELKSHGVLVGDVVNYVRLSPWSAAVARNSNNEILFAVYIRSGEVTGSEDLMERIKNKEVSLVFSDTHQQHIYRWNKKGAGVKKRTDAEEQIWSPS